MTRKALITLLLALGLAVAPAAFALPMDNGRSATTTTAQAPYGMSQAEYKALLLRGSALNQMYGNAVTQLSAAQFKALYDAGGGRLTPQELAALIARGQSLNAQYGGSLGYPYAQASSQPYHAVTIRPDANGPDGLDKSTQIATVSVQAVRPDANGPDGLDKSTQIPTAAIGGGASFEWGSAAIGAGSFAFVALLAIASFALTRRRHHPSF